MTPDSPAKRHFTVQLLNPFYRNPIIGLRRCETLFRDSTFQLNLLINLRFTSYVTTTHRTDLLYPDHIKHIMNLIINLIKYFIKQLLIPLKIFL